MPRVKPKHGKRLYGNLPYSLDSTLIHRVRQVSRHCVCFIAIHCSMLYFGQLGEFFTFA